MFDETNKTEEPGTSFPEKLFESEEPEVNEKLTANHGGEETASETIKIKYNGEERDITLDEARILAQKGMNYDHVVSERDTKYIKELQFLDKVAAKQGMTRAQYMAAHENSPEKKEAQQRNSVGEAVERARTQIKRLSDAVGLSGPWAALFRQYPELSRKDAFSELGEKVKQGFTPLEAYQEKLIREHEQALSIAQKNDAVKAKAVGSLEGERIGRSHDDFLEGFLTDD